MLNNADFGGSGSNNNTIQKNTIKDISGYTLSGWYLAGIWIGEGASLNKILENTISNISFKGNLFNDQYIGDAAAISGTSSYNQVKNNIISNVENGIALVDSINNTVTGNTISVYQECIRGNSVSYNTVNSNTCQQIQRPFGFSASDWLMVILFIIIGVAAGGVILRVVMSAAKKRKLSKQLDGRSSAISDVGANRQITSYTPQASSLAIPSPAPMVIPAPVIPSAQPVLLPINERVAMFYCQSCNQYHEVKNPRFDAWYGCPACGKLLSYITYCPSCHAPMMLSKELYTAYKGKLVQCQACKNQVAVE